MTVATPIGPSLVERLRVALIAVLCASPLFAISNWLFNRNLFPQLTAVRAVQVLLLAVAVLALYGRPTRQRATLVGLSALAVLMFTTARMGILTREVATVPIVAAIVAVGTSTMLPWGAAAQLGAVVVILVATLWNVAALNGSLTSAYAAPGGAMAMVLAASVYVARELERYRVAMARQEHERRRVEDERAALLE